jgi:hypothetical protein
MEKLSREDLLSLEDYAVKRADLRREVMAHKRTRTLAIGPNVTLYFENRTTMQYQVQEMLRAEKIFEPAGIREELEAYNPLIPDGSNLKATMMIEFPDVAERRAMLARLVGIENQTWLAVEGFERVTPHADEDMERADEDKTSSVHFLRFEFSPEMIAALKDGAALAAGVDHDNYRHEVNPVADELRKSLLKDFD